MGAIRDLTPLAAYEGGIVVKISSIIIENFKGIERVELSPIQPINVLIGRNNSGKSSVLACVHFLTRYFDTLKDRAATKANILSVPGEYFRKGLAETSPRMRITVTVGQTDDERRSQFARAVEQWNKRYECPKMDSKRVDDNIQSGTFAELSFSFAALAPESRLDLESIMTPSLYSPGEKPVVIALAKTPGQALPMAGISRLFAHRRFPEFYSESIFNAVK
jgi:hypothetical protein